MPEKWFNLYGHHPPKEMDSWINDIYRMTGLLKLSYEGSRFLGRVLISMNIKPKERPESGTKKTTLFKEP